MIYLFDGCCGMIFGFDHIKTFSEKKKTVKRRKPSCHCAPATGLCCIDSFWGRRSGYLRKRRETDRWLKRWCVLTETSLMYFHKPNDQHPSKIVQVTGSPQRLQTMSTVHRPHTRVCDRSGCWVLLFFAML